MAKRRVNSLLGKSAGYMGLDHYTTVMVCVALPACFIAFLITQNFVPALITGVSVAAAFQLVTNGKPGTFYNSLFKRPHWVRAERTYINEWSPDYTPETSSIRYDSRTFFICGVIYVAVSAFFKPFTVAGLLVFVLPVVPWQRLLKR